MAEHILLHISDSALEFKPEGQYTNCGGEKVNLWAQRKEYQEVGEVKEVTPHTLTWWRQEIVGVCYRSPYLDSSWWIVGVPLCWGFLQTKNKHHACCGQWGPGFNMESLRESFLHLTFQMSSYKRATSDEEELIDTTPDRVYQSPTIQVRALCMDCHIVKFVCSCTVVLVQSEVFSSLHTFDFYLMHLRSKLSTFFSLDF